MKRREFIVGLGGAAVSPFVAHAQQGERVRRIGILLPATADDPAWQARAGAFQQGLGQLGWDIGSNLQIDTRWAASNAAELRKQAAELVAHAPDVIMAGGTSALGPLLQATRTVPIVFTIVFDPVGAGFIDSLARPGGNATGFMNFEYSFSGKWLDLLKEIAPGVTRVAVLRDATQGFAISEFAAIQAVAPSLQGGGPPGRFTRRRRDRARRRGFRARSEWRSDPDWGRCGGALSRSGHHAGGQIQAAGGVFERFFAAAGGLVSIGPITSKRSGKRPATSAVSSRARKRPTCRFRRRPSTNWWST